MTGSPIARDEKALRLYCHSGFMNKYLLVAIKKIMFREYRENPQANSR